jgi:hypothetical protein
MELKTQELKRIDILREEIKTTAFYFSNCSCICSNNKDHILKRFNNNEVLMSDNAKNQLFNIDYKSFANIQLKAFIDIIKAYYKAGYESVTFNSNYFDKISLISEDYIKYSNTTIKVNSESDLKDFGTGKYSIDFLYNIIRDLKNSYIENIKEINIYCYNADFPLLLDFGQYVYFIAPRVNNK